MNRTPRSRLFPWLLLLALSVCPMPTPSQAEPGGKPELAPGQSVDRGRSGSARSARAQALRALAALQAAELDSLGALAKANPADGPHWQREIEGAKRRHTRAEIELQRDLAVRSGDAVLARRLALRLERLGLATGGAR